MANLTIKIPYDMTKKDEYLWTLQSYSNSTIVTSANNDQIRDVYQGVFSFPSYGGVTGTLTSFTHYVNGVEAYSLSDANLDASEAYKYAMYDTYPYNTEPTYAFGLSGNDNIVGSNGNDVIKGYAGDDAINGGDGADVAVYSGFYADYTITKNNNGSIQVIDKLSYRDGSDILTNIESLRFSDQSISANDLTQTAPVLTASQQATQSYLATFGVSLSVAKDFIIANLSNPKHIFDVCKSVGVTNQMIADIVNIPGVGKEQVMAFFTANQLNAGLLDGNAESTPDSNYSTTEINVRALDHDRSLSVTLDASTGAFTFVFDLNERAYLPWTGTYGSSGSTTVISGFSTDDTIKLLSSDGVYLTSNSGSSYLNIDVFGISSNHEQIKLAGFAGQASSVSGFNALSVGDIIIA